MNWKSLGPSTSAQQRRLTFRTSSAGETSEPGPSTSAQAAEADIENISSAGETIEPGPSTSAQATEADIHNISNTGETSKPGILYVTQMKGPSTSAQATRSDTQNKAKGLVSEVSGCSGCLVIVERALTAIERSRYDENPTVLPVLHGGNLVGTCYVWNVRRNNCFVISPSFEGKDCTCLISVKERNERKLFEIRLNRGKESEDFVATAVPDDPRVPITLWNQVISVMLAGRYTCIVSRKARCKRCDKFQTKFISKFCRVKKGTKYSYNYKKIQGDGFKDFPYGAPVVNDEKQVVGIVKS